MRATIRSTWILTKAIVWLITTSSLSSCSLPARNASMFTLTPSRSSSVLQIFPATKLFSDFLWAKMMFTHLSVFSQNKSVWCYCLFIAKSTRFLTLASKGKEKMKCEFYSLGCRKKNFGSQARSNIYYDHHAKNSNSSPPCLIIVHPSLAFMLSRVWL